MTGGVGHMISTWLTGLLRFLHLPPTVRQQTQVPQVRTKPGEVDEATLFVLQPWATRNDLTGRTRPATLEFDRWL